MTTSLGRVVYKARYRVQDEGKPPGYCCARSQRPGKGGIALPRGWRATWHASSACDTNGTGLLCGPVWRQPGIEGHRPKTASGLRAAFTRMTHATWHGARDIDAHHIRIDGDFSAESLHEVA